MGLYGMAFQRCAPRAAERSQVGWRSHGAAGLRRASFDTERLGARGSAWFWVSGIGGRACAPACISASLRPISWVREGGARGRAWTRQHDWLGEWFRNYSQASGANRRVQRASVAALALFVGQKLRWMALHSMALLRGRSRWVIDFILRLGRVHSYQPQLLAPRGRERGAVESGATGVRMGLYAMAFQRCAPRAASRCSRDGVDALDAGAALSSFRRGPRIRRRAFGAHTCIGGARPHTSPTAHARAAASVGGVGGASRRAFGPFWGLCRRRLVARSVALRVGRGSCARLLFSLGRGACIGWRFRLGRLPG
jgi:hypothetical protein